MASLQEEAGVKGKRALLATLRQKRGRVEAWRENSLRSHPKTKARARGGGIDNVNKDE